MVRPPSGAALGRRSVLTILLAALLAGAEASQACVGASCLQIWSSEAGGGSLAVSWASADRRIQTFRSVCAAGECLYGVIDPGFLLGEAPAPLDLYPLLDGVTVRVEIVAADPAVTLRINGVGLRQPGDSAALGRAPEIHVHPAWQIRQAEGVVGDHALSFLLRTDSPLYRDSEAFALVLTNRATPTPDAPPPTGTPTPTPTAEPRPCRGDCDGDGRVAVAEMISGVGAALTGAPPCRALDGDDDGVVSIAELVAAVQSALGGCPIAPTPTATMPVRLADIQAAIFSPRCAIPACHDATSGAGGLVLDAGSAHAQLVGVMPAIESARDQGLLRVDPGQPDNTFLIRKLEGPPPDQGSRMPLAGAPLTADETALIRRWVAAGAAP